MGYTLRCEEVQTFYKDNKQALIDYEDLKRILGDRMELIKSFECPMCHKFGLVVQKDADGSNDQLECLNCRGV